LTCGCESCHGPAPLPILSFGEEPREDIFVASFGVLQDKETANIHSYCVWSKTVDTLLPKAEEVYFVVVHGKEGGDVVARADWERVVKVVGGLMTPQGMYPERYRVTKFPTKKQLAKLNSE
jgi:hypothetical protein